MIGNKMRTYGSKKKMRRQKYLEREQKREIDIEKQEKINKAQTIDEMADAMNIKLK